MTFGVNSIDLPGRTRLQYVEQGDPSGVPMILLHGLTDSWRSFEFVLPHLPRTIRAFAVTQRGHGDAVRPETGYRTRDFSADIAAFTHALGLGPAIVVGHSMGSVNALRFAIDHPHLTLGLALAGAFASFQRNPGMVEFLGTEVGKLTDPIDPAFALEFQESTLHRPVSEGLLKTAVEESLKVPALVWRAAAQGLLEDDFSGELQRIKAPTLIVWGDRDAFCPRADQDILLEAIKDSRLEIYEDTGHALHWEQPRRFAAHIVQFARRCSHSGELRSQRPSVAAVS